MQICFPYTQFTFVFTLTIFILCTWTYFGRVLSRCPNLKLADLFFYTQFTFVFYTYTFYFCTWTQFARTLSRYNDLLTHCDFSLFFTQNLRLFLHLQFYILTQLINTLWLETCRAGLNTQFTTTLYVLKHAVRLFTTEECFRRKFLYGCSEQ